MTESNHPVPDPAAEPIETEQQARQLPAVQAVYAAFDADPGPGKMTAPNLRMLLDAVGAAGVRIGAYDVRILEWLAGWEPATSAVIAGLITRAADTGTDAGKLAVVRAVLAAFDWEFDDRQLALEHIERLVGEDASPEDAVRAAVTGLAEPSQDTLRQAFADAIAYRMAKFAESATCAECTGHPQPCGEHQDHRDGASLYQRLAAEFGIDPDAEPGSDL